MKYKYMLAIAFGLCSFFGVTKYVQSKFANNLKLFVSTPKNTFTTGEIIPFVCELKNEGSEEVILEDTLDPTYGSLKFYLFDEKKDFKYSYINPNWGILEVNGSSIKIKKNEALTNYGQILSGINSDKRAEYYFDTSGTYYLQASYQIQLRGQAKYFEVKSELIKIVITQPLGEDLEVWNQIKNRGDYGYFIQNGDFIEPFYKVEERKKLQQEVEDILAKYPNSFYAASLSQSLAKFKASEAKRCELMEKMKPNP